MKQNVKRNKLYFVMNVVVFPGHCASAPLTQEKLFTIVNVT